MTALDGEAGEPPLPDEPEPPPAVPAPLLCFLPDDPPPVLSSPTPAPKSGAGSAEDDPLLWLWLEPEVEDDLRLAGRAALRARQLLAGAVGGQLVLLPGRGLGIDRDPGLRRAGGGNRHADRGAGDGGEQCGSRAGHRALRRTEARRPVSSGLSVEARR